MNNRLPAIAWIAISFGLCLLLALVSVHLFQIPAFIFMSPVWWWLDIAGGAVSLGVWHYRDTKRAPAPTPV
ncbi:MAG: hypothetical protein RSP_17860 [Rhodanobacter sp.]